VLERPRPAGTAGGGRAMTAIRKVKLSDQLYEQLLALIIKGEFAEGDQLPSEMELALRFSLSRPVVREALARLREERVITSRKGAGSFVLRRPPPLSQVYAPIQSLRDIRLCYEFRAMLEGEAAELAASRRSDEDLERILAPVEALAKAVAERRAEMAVGFAFHRAIAQAARNHFLTTTLDLIHDQLSFAMTLQRNLSLTPPTERHTLILKEHRAIFEAIKDGAPARARSRMRGHILRSWERLYGDGGG
jgi:GntR family transcriptional regulator, transcriptional repressor for pyruvate dehydrogenase complex